jgi:hypothetical protein
MTAQGRQEGRSGEHERPHRQSWCEDVHEPDRDREQDRAADSPTSRSRTAPASTRRHRRSGPQARSSAEQRDGGAPRPQKLHGATLAGPPRYAPMRCRYVHEPHPHLMIDEIVPLEVYRTMRFPDALVAPGADWGITVGDSAYAEVVRDPAWGALRDELRGEDFVRCADAVAGSDGARSCRRSRRRSRARTRRQAPCRCRPDLPPPGAVAGAPVPGTCPLADQQRSRKVDGASEPVAITRRVRSRSGCGACGWRARCRGRRRSER